MGDIQTLNTLLASPRFKTVLARLRGRLQAFTMAWDVEQGRWWFNLLELLGRMQTCEGGTAKHFLHDFRCDVVEREELALWGERSVGHDRRASRRETPPALPGKEGRSFASGRRTRGDARPCRKGSGYVRTLTRAARRRGSSRRRVGRSGGGTPSGTRSARRTTTRSGRSGARRAGRRSPARGGRCRTPARPSAGEFTYRSRNVSTCHCAHLLAIIIVARRPRCSAGLLN